eukprot:CAMPEP_0201987020 /NCGR_PEP_ID=MMETSP0904-20121228/91576_1 /ASSEMBLY_ACC=CAM_ASM_000553 /TAXON_ID=420261 /ORGANISM="Thalassiosira antarctica, Strain CCMP982" /LENGTH=265 /DNA_ID=CAMNT_0048541107 /DNA_START=25 /DNA_END=823 /DNA_ORIENTATION=+
MMKIAVLAALAGSAAAFAPAQTAKATTTLAAFETELGAQAPLGFFDPLGLLDEADQARFDRLRFVEIKHGRVAQLAFLGQVVTRAGIHLPGNIDYAGHEFSSFGNGWAALDGPNAIPQEGVSQLLLFVGLLEASVMIDVPDTGNEFVGDFRNGFIDFGWDTFDEETKLSKRAIELNNPQAGFAQIFAFIGALELGVMKDIEGTGNEFIGDFRNGAIDFGWDTFDEETKLSKRAIELNNGRAAMLGITGLMIHEQLGTVLPIIGQV